MYQALCWLLGMQVKKKTGPCPAHVREKTEAGEYVRAGSSGSQVKCPCSKHGILWTIYK